MECHTPFLLRGLAAPPLAGRGERAVLRSKCSGLFGRDGWRSCTSHCQYSSEMYGPAWAAQAVLLLPQIPFKGFEVIKGGLRKVPSQERLEFMDGDLRGGCKRS